MHSSVVVMAPTICHLKSANYQSSVRYEPHVGLALQAATYRTLMTTCILVVYQFVT